MRILFVSREYPPGTAWGGIATYVRTIAHAMARRGHDVHVLSTVDGQAEEDVIDRGVHVHRRGWGGVPRALGRLVAAAPVDVSARLLGALAVRRALDRLGRGFDVVEAADWHAEALLLGSSHASAVVVQLHGPLAVLARSDGVRPGPALSAATRLEARALRRATALVSPTRFMASAVAAAHHVDRARIQIEPFPVEPPPEGLPPASDAAPQVLFVGRLQRLKNPELIVKAAALVLQRVPDARFVFAGDGAAEHAAALRTLAAAQGEPAAFEFAGRVDPDRLLWLRARSRVCVIPSRIENCPFTVMEAMVAGRPVIASAVGGIPELVADGVHGYLLDPDDVAGWAGAIVRVLREPALADALGHAGRVAALERFSPEQAAATRESTYQAALHGPRIAVGQRTVSGA